MKRFIDLCLITFLEHYDEVWRRIFSQAEARALSNPEFEFECEEEEQTTEGYTDE